MNRLPLWLKVAYTLWMLLWVPAYWSHYGPVNFLWLCDVANFVILVALWTESSLLLSAQAVAVLLVQVAWIVDLGGRLLLGFHPIGGTEYMLDPAKPLYLRLLSLFHVTTPPLLLWTLSRLGYDRRGWKVESVFCAVVLLVSYLVAEPADNVNWLYGPFNLTQTLLPPPLYFAACLLLYPLVLFWPTHLALDRLLPARSRA